SVLFCLINGSIFLIITNLIIAGRFRTYEMKIKKIQISAAFLLLFLITGNAQTYEIPKVSENQLHHHVSYLASDSLKGRGTGTPELPKAAGYLEQKLRELNLTSPATGYYQHFVLTSSHHDQQNSYIRILDKKGKVKKYIQSFIPQNQTAESLELEGELI